MEYEEFYLLTQQALQGLKDCRGLSDDDVSKAIPQCEVEKYWRTPEQDALKCASDWIDYCLAH